MFSDQRISSLKRRIPSACRSAPTGASHRRASRARAERRRGAGQGIAYLSLDPAMRGWMNEGKSLHPAGGHRRGDARRRRRRGDRVAATPAFAVGDTVYGTLGVQEYADACDGKRALTKVDPRARAAAAVYLGALGMPGMTAYFGLLDVGQPQAGRDGRGLGRGRRRRPDGRARSRRSRAAASSASPAAPTSATASSTSSASTPAIDYKAERREGRPASEHCPKGVDVYFDNVGGEILDAVLAQHRAQRAHRDLRRDLAVQQHDRRARARRTTCRCWSTAPA